MFTKQEIEGGWTELKGAAKNRWGELSDDELTQFEGAVEEFIGLLQRKTGEAKAEIERWLSELDESVRPRVNDTVGVARERLGATMESAEEMVEAVQQRVAQGQQEAARMVRRHPAESVAVAFGSGIVAGVIIGLLTRGRT